MSRTVSIRLLPLGKKLELEAGASLQDALFNEGVEFPCGGRGRCKGCRVRVTAGHLPATVEDEHLLSAAELAAGWRLACRARPETDLEIDLAQWEATILSDEAELTFTPGEGLGVAIDLGTTTIVAQLLDLETGAVLGVRTGLNAQARHGADIMSRIDHATRGQGRLELTRLVREQIGSMLIDLAITRAPCAQLHRVLLAGNTVMHHLFCGLDVEPLSHSPFEPVSLEACHFRADALGWHLPGNPEVCFLPGLGGFVGSDLLAGILSVRLHTCRDLTALLDLGTNGEIILGNHERILCASTAAGPAFEGARISMGMRAATGAISAVTIADGRLECHVLGHGSPRGICGSGLVDGVAAGLELGWVQPSGRLTTGSVLPLAPPVELTQGDIRELQLAKGAIAAGLRLLASRWGTTLEDIAQVYLAGAFGNYISRQSAQRIGLLRMPPSRVAPAGNTALRGVKLALFAGSGEDLRYEQLRRLIEHVPLNEDPHFQDVFVEEMRFP